MRTVQSIRLLSNKRWEDFPITDDLNVEVFKTGQHFTLVLNIVSDHKPCCTKDLRKLVSVSYSQEIFSSSRWIIEDFGRLPWGFFFIPEPVLSVLVLKALCILWRPLEPMTINWCCLFSDHSAWIIFKSLMFTLGLSITTWINLVASKTFNDTLKFFLKLVCTIFFTKFLFFHQMIAL